MDLQIIFPATDKLIKKYTKENSEIFEETYEIYSKVSIKKISFPFFLIKFNEFLLNNFSHQNE